ncbi:PEP-CTERM system TPR-repeat protein PrsT [Massilia arenosa]|uniref:PEP-CTERM system TPR-repeat protein PrsT n=1 Tax=Zemynaea arenosa TaxID=2561931 RepID=A0A4Y9SB64_9BURK|nr:XrtA/PEP-CTERM system TPR-repeat protein PrsT [Massilia arenosa]TFW19437.1 PEP-CTERM system TPR-repeat protein PrsT [Massilia arenosa]
MSRSSKRLALATAVSGALLIGAGLAGCHSQSTEQLLAEAKQYEQKGDNKAALIQLKNAATKSPEAADVRLQLGDLYTKTSDYLSAEKEYRKALELKVPKERVLLPLAKAMIVQNQFQKVLDETADHATTPEIITVRGEAYLGLNDLPHAKEQFEAALKLKPEYADALIGMARYSMATRDLDSASKYADEAIAKNPKNDDALFFKGAMLRATGKPLEAIAAFDQVAKLNPEHRFAYVEKAALEISQNKLDAAQADLDLAKKQNPNSLQVLYTDALLQFTRGHSAKALEILTKVLRVVPDHYPSILLAGACEVNTGANEQANQHLRKYIEKYPNNIYARKLLAATLLRGGQAPDALAVLAPALKDNATDPQLMALAGQGHLEAREFGKASEYFDKAAKLEPQAASLRTSLGLAKLGEGDADDAIRELEKAAELDAKTPNAALALIRTEMGLKQYDKALAEVNKLEKSTPNNPVILNIKGGVLLAKQDRAGARAVFEKAVAAKPDYFPAVANLAQLDVGDNKLADARKRLQAFVDKNPKSATGMSALASLALRENKVPEATSWLEKANAANPDDVGPALQLGTFYLRQGEKQKALTLIRKYQTVNPTNADLLDLLGQIQVSSADLPGALETFSKLVNVQPKSPLAQMRLAGVHMMMKNDSLAEDDLKKALQLDPNFIEAQMAQVELHVRRNRPDDALAVARAMQKQRPRLPVGFAVEGDIYMAQRKPELALKAYEQAFDRMKSSDMLIKVVNAMTASGKVKEADARLAAWRKERPNDLMVAMAVSDRLLANRQYKEALPILEQLATKPVTQVAALNNMAYAYQQLKDGRAAATAEQALKLAPENAAVNDTLGWILAEQGDHKRALPLLQKASKLAPDLPDVRYHLAVSLSRTGDKAGAKKELEQLLAKNQGFAQADEARALLKQL